VTQRRPPSLSSDEAQSLHSEALVIDSQQPFVTSGIVFTPGMREALAELVARGRTQAEIFPLLGDTLAREIQTSSEARDIYLDKWRRSGVTAACGTLSALETYDMAFERAVREIANCQAIASALSDHLIVARQADDIERAHNEGKHAVIIDFQNSVAFGDVLDRVGLFHGLGLRMVQLTYNLQNLVGSGCTETYQGGLTYFGREFVQRLNEHRILVDVSHCSEQVGWDAIEVSSAPVIVSHSSSKAVVAHDRGKSDELARAIAEQGGYFGVVVVPGFVKDSPGATLDDFVRHVEHLVDVCGIDHVGIGTDKGGPGPTTGTVIDFPDDLPWLPPGQFSWSGFREEEHRLTPDYNMEGFEDFADWPNVTAALAQAGFTEEELRKLLGLNFLRVFREVVG
jgi:membrane dipeptidase